MSTLNRLDGLWHSENRRTITIVSKMAQWDSRASVRAHPRRMLREEEAAGKLFFTPELVPAAEHTLVRALGPEAVRELHVRHLHRYLDFTTRLELEVVNKVARDIALDRAGPAMPEVMRADAFKLCTDEAHHAYFSDDMQRQVMAATDIAPDRRAIPPFLRHLRALTRGLPREQRRLGVVLFAVVSETLISGILAQVPRDERVVRAVRALIADHAEDEGRHSAFFSQFFAYLWPRLDRDLRGRLGPLLPRFILAFLEPDRRGIGRDLARLGLRPDEVAAVLAQAYPADQVISRARDAAKVTLHLFSHHQVTDDPRIADAFSAQGLTD
jgi:hypothetical protein